MADGLTIGQAAAFAGVTVKIPPGLGANFRERGF